MVRAQFWVLKGLPVVIPDTSKKMCVARSEEYKTMGYIYENLIRHWLAEIALVEAYQKMR
jgi:hypothetical protein